MSIGSRDQLKNTLHIKLVENLHIFLWLIKDLCWSMEWKPGGVIMIVPTISVAIYITWRCRSIMSEMIHSLAVTCWITANSVWMIGEFTGRETRAYAAAIFCVGLLFIIYYYLFHFRKEQEANREMVSMAVSDSPTSGR